MTIKLFGKTIQTPSTREVLVMHRESSGEDDDDDKAASNKEDSHESIDPNLSDEEMSEEPSSSATNEMKSNPETQKANGRIDKPFRKPDIILPCPRCKSTQTKFCYFNNYNVKQPRHFCKNCQRYWTAGGSIRNVPVGAGRRKSKSFAVIGEPIRHARPRKPNGALLSFGADAPLCQSMASVPNFVEKKKVMKKSANETNEAENSNFCGSNRCLNECNWANTCSHIPPQNTAIPFYLISAYWGTPDYGQHH